MKRLLIRWNERTPPTVRGLLGLWLIVGLLVYSIPNFHPLPPAVAIILGTPLMVALLMLATYTFLHRLYWLSWPIRKAWGLWGKRKAAEGGSSSTPPH